MENKKLQAKELLEKTGEAVLYMNPKGEFFTREDLAKNSLSKGEKLEVFDVETGNNDDVYDVLEKIQAAEDTDVLYEMLDAEKEGNNNEDVIGSIEERIKELENAE